MERFWQVWMSTDIGKLTAALQKEFGAASVMSLSDVPVLDVISSGIPSLDYATGIGGYPRRLITEIFGPESIGKSVLSMKAIASAQQLGLIPVLITTEGIPDKRWAEVQGVDLDNLVVLFAHTAEQMVEQAKTVSANDQVGLMVIDSVAAVGTQKEISDGGNKQAFGISGQIAHMMHALLPNCWDTNKACILINQLRDVPNQMGYKMTDSPGGRSLKHAASMRIKLKQGDKKQDTVMGVRQEIGKEVIANIHKNKAGSPFKTASWWVFHTEPDEPGPDFPGRGVDISSSLFDVAKAIGLIEGKVKLSIPVLNYEQDNGNGRDRMVKWLRENPMERSKLYYHVSKKLKEDGAEPVSETTAE